MSFLSIIYNVLVHPSQEFKVTSIGPVPKDVLTIYGALIVFMVSGAGVTYLPAVQSIGNLFFKFVLYGIMGLMCWFLVATVFSVAAYVFNMRGRPQTFLILTAYSVIPWMFLPVLALFKSGLGVLGSSINVLGLSALWLWTTFLFLMALKYTYSLTWERVVLAAGLPFIMAFLGISWTIGFFVNLFHIVSANI